MKKIILALALLLSLLTGCPDGGDGGPTGPTANDKITALQVRLVDANVYSIAIDRETPLVKDTWTNVSITVENANVEWDGINFNTTGSSTPNSTLWTALISLRFCMLSASAEEEVAVYIDNLSLSGASTPLNLDFEGSGTYLYDSYGVEGPDSNTLQTIDGQTCLQIQGTTAAGDGDNVIALQVNYSLGAAYDVSTGYTVSFDYYIPTNLP